MTQQEQEQEYDYEDAPRMQHGLPAQFNPAVHDVILNNEFIIDSLCRTLRGEIIDPTTNTIKKIGDPIVDAVAMNWIISRVAPYTSKIFSLSYLGDEILGELLFEFEETVSLELMEPKHVGATKHNRDYIKTLMVHTATVTAHKARQAQTLKKLLESHQVQEQSFTQQQSKPGLFSRFKI